MKKEILKKVKKKSIDNNVLIQKYFFHLFGIPIIKTETYQVDTNTEPSESKPIFFIFQRRNARNMTSNQCRQINARDADGNRYSKMNRNAIVCIGVPS